MLIRKILFIYMLVLVAWTCPATGQTIYIDPIDGVDTNDGGSPTLAKQSLEGIRDMTFREGAKILLRAGSVVKGTLELRGVKGTLEQPVTISSYWEGVPAHFQPALIDGAGYLSAICLDDCSHITVSKLRLTANGGGFKREVDRKEAMRVGLLVRSVNEPIMEHIHLNEVEIFDVFSENTGYVRDPKDSFTANGTQSYGYGIRFISLNPAQLIKNISVNKCLITRMSHTGIKVTARRLNISAIDITDNQVLAVGGPGMQFSQTAQCYIARNTVHRSGCPDDSRSWKRGSGMWMYGSDGFLIEHNRFTNANGPNDSAGAHIDCNNKNIVLQYNLSANNAGGFVEILGNSSNCCYRYNVSVNDGWRVAKKRGGGGLKAANNGEIIWLAGYMGDAPNRGPYNSYIYNNTIYVDSTMSAGYFFQQSIEGVLIANNIFNIVGSCQSHSRTPGKVDQGDVMIRNNLFCRQDNWPVEETIKDTNPLYGEARFVNPGGLNIVDYIPTNRKLIRKKGIRIEKLAGDDIGVKIGLEVSADILGNPVGTIPDLGAISSAAKK